MKRTRRHFSSNFKTRVVLEALKERESTHQLAEKYELHPNQISSWKKEFLENADKAFGEAKSGKDNQQERIDELYRQVGQMKVENDWLKKKAVVKPLAERKRLIEADHAHLSISRQCRLLSMARSSYYYSPQEWSRQDLDLMHRMDRLY